MTNEDNMKLCFFNSLLQTNAEINSQFELYKLRCEEKLDLRPSEFRRYLATEIEEFKENNK